MSKVFRTIGIGVLFATLFSIQGRAEEMNHANHLATKAVKSESSESIKNSPDESMAGMGAMHAKMMAQMHGQGHAMMGGCGGHSPTTEDNKK